MTTTISIIWVVILGAAAEHYTPQWAIHIEGGHHIANEIAAKHGFINRGKIFDDLYHFEHQTIRKRSIEPNIEHHERLSSDNRVKWVKQQVVKSRQKRDYISTRNTRAILNDPRWPQMWYLVRGNGLDMNVQAAWKEGVTGKGVVVTILDDGLEIDHPDIARNYDPQASYDVNNHDENPMPRYDWVDSNRHGTRCAGEVAAVANNSLCAVGIAFGASVGGVRMLDGDVTDAVEARSLSLNPQHIDIYSASWGPDDDGKTVDGPGELATRAFVEGVTKGRNGKGSIFVWASGNGGREHDNCNCDGYTNSIWTLSISSATENGIVPWYSEACSSTLATTYSSGAAGERMIVTTDIHHQCTTSHTGTSASAPLAAGICALALEANRQLTWRDMQHIVIRSAKPMHLMASDWRVNGVGRNVSHSFGYGLMDAAAMVRTARTWKTVPEQHKCEIKAPQADRLIPAKSQVVLKLEVKDCPGVNFLEHVQAKVSLAASRRGDLQIHLTSPAGTRSTLLARRPQDVSKAGFTWWPFMTVHTWGERPVGVWQLEIHNEGRYLGRATLRTWSLIFYGTTVSLDEKYQSTSTSPRTPQRTINPPKVSIPGEKKRKGNNKGRNKSTTSLTTTTRTTPSITSVSLSRNNLKPTSKPKAKTVTNTPQPSSSTRPKSKPTRVEIVYPVFANFQLYNNNNMTFLPQDTSSKKSIKPRPKENRQGKKKRPDSFVSSLPTKGLDLRQDDSLSMPSTTNGNFTGWKLILHGTETLPKAGDQLLNNDDNDDDENTNNNNNMGRSKTNTGVRPNIKQAKVTTEKQEIHSETLSSNNNGIIDTSSGTGCVVLARSGHQCIECEDKLFIYEGACIPHCPPRTHIGLSPKGQSACLSCHYLCLTCNGPNIDQCLSCSPDSNLLASGMCLPLSVTPLIQSSRWYYWMFVALMLNFMLLFVLICYLFIKWCGNSDNRTRYEVLKQQQQNTKSTRVNMSDVTYISDDSDVDEH